MNNPIPLTRQEQLIWLKRIKGPMYVRDIEHYSDEEIQKQFSLIYTEFLRLEECAEELLL